MLNKVNIYDAIALGQRHARKQADWELTLAAPRQFTTATVDWAPEDT